MERYYKAFEETYKKVKANSSVKVDEKGSRFSAFVDGYVRGIVINENYVSINYNLYKQEKITGSLSNNHI